MWVLLLTYGPPFPQSPYSETLGESGLGASALVRKAPVSRSRLVADLSPAVPGFFCGQCF